MTIQEVLQQSTIDGMVVRLPNVKLDRNEYMDVAKQLELIGGKWKGGKVAGFVFQEDPTDLLAQIAAGEKRNLKKEFQFFGTSDNLSETLVEMANPSDEDLILEPSAGQGAIVKAINRHCDPMEVHCYELMPLNQTFLGKISNVTLLGEDFLKAPDTYKYDCIIANPPFAKNQDIDHIYKMHSLLKEGGRLVTIASKHWQMSTNKKEVAFREFLAENNAEIIEVDGGEFKESGTNIKTVIIKLVA